MARRPFEIVAECLMVGFPSGADIERLTARLEQVRAGRSDVVKATVTPPAIYRDSRYLLDARFLVWAEDPAGATSAAEDLLRAAEVPCRFVAPSGRALVESEVPRQRAAKAAAKAVRPPAPAKSARSGASKKKAARPAKPKARVKSAARPKSATKSRGKPAKAKRPAAKAKRPAPRAKRPAAKKRRSR